MTLIFDSLGGNYRSGESNIGTEAINTEGEYVDLSGAFSDAQDGDMFTIQVQNTCWLREGENGDGFYVNDIKPFYYEYSSDYPLYIRSLYNPVIENT